MPRCRFQPDPWAQWIQDHSLSNLSVADFCANHQLPVHSFYFWRRKLTLSLGDCPRFLATEWNNRGQPETPVRRSSRVISVRRFEFFQPIAVLAAARYCGAATTYSLLSPKISKASSRIGRNSGKIGQLRMPRPS